MEVSPGVQFHLDIRKNNRQELASLGHASFLSLGMYWCGLCQRLGLVEEIHAHRVDAS